MQQHDPDQPTNQPATPRRVWWCILLERATTEDLEQFHLNVAMEAGSLQGYTRLAIPYGRTDVVRNLAARKFLTLSRNPDDVLIMLDQDHAHPADILTRLVSATSYAPVIGALAFQRGEPYGPCFYTRNQYGTLAQAYEWDRGGLYPCAAIGHAAVAIKRSAFEQLGRAGTLYPFWRYAYPNEAALVEVEGRLIVDPDVDPLPMQSEDIYFSRRCELAGVPIMCDTSIVCPHKIGGGWVDESSWEDWKRDHPIAHHPATVGAVQNDPAAALAAEEARQEDVRRAPHATVAASHEVDIIIPGWNNFDLTRALLRSLRQTADVAYRIIYVDNGSDREALESFLADANGAEPKNGWPQLEVVRLDQNEGFVAAINAGMARALPAAAPYLLWLNNDVEIPKGDALWLRRLVAHFSDPTIGAVGAVSNNVFGHQRRAGPAQHDGEHLPATLTPYLIGFAFLVARKAALAVGSLDTGFGVGNFEDVDYSIRVRAAGYRLAVAETVWLHHAMHASFKKRADLAFDELLRRNRLYLCRKWGGDYLTQMGLDQVVAEARADGAEVPAAAWPRELLGYPVVQAAVGAFSGDQAAERPAPASESPTTAANGAPAALSEPGAALVKTWRTDGSAEGIGAAVRLVTHATADWLPHLKPYLESLDARWPWPALTALVVDARADVTLPPALVVPGIAYKLVEPQPGAPEGTASLQHGAFERFTPGHAGDLLLYTDGDIRLQRSPNDAEAALIAQLPDDEVLVGYNSSPYETLALEATRLHPRFDPATVFDGRLLAQGSCWNIGVIGARRATWRKIHARYMELWPTATRLFAHRARQQWLVCYVIEELGLLPRPLPYTFHMHGCYPLPVGGEVRDGLATYEGRPVLFRHHIP